MAFFDDLGKKLSQAGQTAVQKTKDMTDIARLNGQISEEEKKINNTYYQIGKLYVATYQNNYQDEFIGLVNAIRESESKIDDCKQQIKDIKGITHCEKCGAEVPSNVAFCSSCGAAMPVQAPVNPDMIKCAGCGAMVNKNMRFCTNCGKPIVAPAAPAAPVVEPVAPVAEPAAPVVEPAAPVVEPVAPAVEPAADKCANCGAELEQGMAFCTNCGTPVGAAPVANKCPNCGAELADDCVFCTECGTKCN